MRPGRGGRGTAGSEAWMGGVRASGSEWEVVPSAASSSSLAGGTGGGFPGPPLLWPTDPAQPRQEAGLPVIPGLSCESSRGIRWSRNWASWVAGASVCGTSGCVVRESGKPIHPHCGSWGGERGSPARRSERCPCRGGVVVPGPAVPECS